MQARNLRRQPTHRVRWERTCGNAHVGKADALSAVPPNRLGAPCAPPNNHSALHSTHENKTREGARARTECAVQDGAKQVGLPGRR